MPKEEELGQALEKLADILEQEKREIDPELFAPIRQAILDQSKELKQVIEKLKTGKVSENLLVEAKVQTKQLTHLGQTLVEMFRPGIKQLRAKQSWWEKTFGAGIDKIIDFFSEQLDKTRKSPKFAIGVKLATKDGEKFYDAIGGAVGRAVGGVMSRSATSALALETTLQSVLTQITAVNANTDGLEGYTDGLETLLTDLKGFVDGLEGFVDGIEGLLTTGNSSLSSIDTKTPTLGQALAASSTPVVLPATQITTLTPPAAITGFATSAKQDTLLAELQLKADLTETQPVNTELPAAAALADDVASNPTTPTVGAVILGMDATGADNIDRARLAKAHDLDSSGNTEYATGVSLRKKGASGSVPVDDYPEGATPETAASGNVANGNAVATLATAAGKTTYITGFACTGSGSTVGSVVNVTVVGVITGTLTFTFAAPTGVLLMGTPLIVSFPKPIPASATNTTIVVTLPALGAGNTNASASVWGYQL